jgi:hypothetical protein
MHSAVTLAASVGRLIARELIDGSVEPGLAGCRLHRFGPRRTRTKSDITELSDALLHSQARPKPMPPSHGP